MKFIELVNSLGTRKSLKFITLIFFLLVVASAALGFIYGLTANLFEIILIPSQFNVLFHLKAISLFMYSLLGFVISILLLLQDSLQKISSEAKISIILLLFVVEFIFLFEFVWNFFFWFKNNLADSFFFLFVTKTSLVIIFSCISLQTILLFKKERWGRKDE